MVVVVVEVAVDDEVYVYAYDFVCLSMYVRMHNHFVNVHIHVCVCVRDYFLYPAAPATMRVSSSSSNTGCKIRSNSVGVRRFILSTSVSSSLMVVLI